MESLGQRIAARRKAAGYTQEKLAEMVGVSSQAVSKWENDLSCPDISLLPRLANAFHCTIDELLTGDKSEASVVSTAPQRNPDELVLRIRVLTAEGDRIQINLPLPLIRALSQCGIDIASQYSGSNVLNGVDFEKILQLAESGIVGKILELECADGDTVEIVVE